MVTKNNPTPPSHPIFLRFAILGVFWLYLLALLAGCSLEGDISAVMRKAGLYTITFNANGATSGRAAAAMTARTGSAVTLPGGEGLHYPGYVFAGWNPDSSGAGSTYPAGAAYSGSRNVTLYAVWGAVVTEPPGTIDGDGSSGGDNNDISKLPGTFPVVPDINTSFTVGLTLESLALPSDYAWDDPAFALNAGNGQAFSATYTNPSGNYETASGSIMVNVDKAAGAVVSGPPTLASKTHNSITVNAVSISGANFGGQAVEYAINTIDSVPAAGWQSGLTFSSLNPLIDYYLFARSQENVNYNAGTASAGLIIKPNITSTSGIALAWIPEGTFIMGSSEDEVGRWTDEGPQHEVALTNGFYMGVYQVTQKEWEMVMGQDDRYNKVYTSFDYGRGDNFPMYWLNWYDALVFCNRLSVAEGLTPAYSMPGYSNSTNPADWGVTPSWDDSTNSAIWATVEIVSGSTGYRLPTEAQWEYACRAGATTAFNDGLTDDWTDSASVELLGWYDFNSGYQSHEVGGKLPNAWGLYDMHGNVWEWCWDWYDSSYYSVSPNSDPLGPDTSPGGDRVIRGGSFANDADNARSASRPPAYPLAGERNQGLRLVRP